ncbi:MAG: VWA domain-containing protein [Alphaproteobacteria bacterium]|nr:VWA domain-containing protein [Alphaproteobacteria bacterium]
MKFLEAVEVEERIGKVWNRLVAGQASWPSFPDAGVTLASVQTSLSVFFHGLGGDPGLSLAPAVSRSSEHRLTWRQRLGMDSERLSMASRDERSLSLPERLDHFPDPGLNRALYFWLAAYFTALEPPEPQSDPLLADLDFLRRAGAASRQVLAAYPGLAARHAALCAALRSLRPKRPLNGIERAVNELVEALLGGPSLAPDHPFSCVLGGQLPKQAKASSGYKPFLPVPLWGEALIRPPQDELADDGETEEGGASGKNSEESAKRYLAERQDMKDADRKDGLILNRFEKILSFAEMMAINRSTDDMDEEEAKKAAEDLQVLTLGKHWRKPATKLKIDLDLAPNAADLAHLTGENLYPEWDYRLRDYHQDYCRVLTSQAPLEGEGWVADESVKKRIRRIRRQFEALLNRPVLLRAQPDGSELDIDALVRASSDLKACGYASERVYLQHRKQERDLAVVVLVDASLSTDAWIENRRVLDVEKEALTVFANVLEACGDSFSILTFTSKKRTSVRVETIKGFEEHFSEQVVKRIGALKPGYYTRIGAAVRHASAQLEQRPNRHRLLLVITDGKPNDIDHYEGRYGLDDTRKSIREARALGHKVFGVTVDRKAQDYFPYLFGRGSFAIISHLAHLTGALPRLYQHLAAA